MFKLPRHAPIYVAFGYAVLAFFSSVGLAYIEGRLMTAQPGVQPFSENYSTLIDFILLNPLVIYFFLKSAREKQEAYSRMCVEQSMSRYNQFGLALVALAVGYMAMHFYVIDFFDKRYFDATIVELNGEPAITITGWVVFAFTALFISFVSYMAVLEFHYVKFILSVSDDKFSYNPFDSDNSGGLAFLAKPSLTAIYGATFIAVIFVVFVIQDNLVNGSASNRLYLTAAYVPAVILLLGFPLHRLHLLMVKKRQAFIDNISVAMNREFKDKANMELSTLAEATDYLAFVENIEKYRKLCSELPLWPLPVKTLATPAMSAIASLIPLLEKIVTAS